MTGPTGVITALVTPFLGGKIDWKSFERLVEFQCDNQVDGLIVAGSTGEAASLTDEERGALLTRAKKLVDKKLAVWIGTGASSTAQTVLWTQQAQSAGADGALVVTPPYNKPPQRGLYAHFAAVAAEVDIPMMLYNVPSRTAVDLGVEVTLELAQIKNIVSLKDATAQLERVEALKSKLPGSFSLLSGDDESCFDYIVRGGHGVVSVASNILPRQFASLTRAARGGQSVGSDFARWLGLCKMLFVESNPIPVKAALQMMGIISSDELRLPLVRLAQPWREQLRAMLESLELLS